MIERSSCFSYKFDDTLKFVDASALALFQICKWLRSSCVQYVLNILEQIVNYSCV